MKRLRAITTPRILTGDRHALFLALVRANGLPTPTPEVRFAPPRRWRFDYGFPDAMIALEVEGGAYTRGRHVRGMGFVADMEKYSEAAVRGWCVIRVTPQQLATLSTIELLQRAFQLRTQSQPSHV